MAQRNHLENSKPKLKNCVICGKIFASMWGNTTCNDCRKEIAEKEQAVTEYIIDHKDATLQEVADECGVTVKFIRKMIDAGKITIQNENMSYPCNGCGKPIMVGQYCEECLMKIQIQIDKAKSEMKQQHLAELAANKGKGKGERLYSSLNDEGASARKNMQAGGRAPTLRETIESSPLYKAMKGLSTDSADSSKSSKKSSKSSKSKKKS